MSAFLDYENEEYCTLGGYKWRKPEAFLLESEYREDDNLMVITKKSRKYGSSN